MATTRSFKELVQAHIASDPAFAEALLSEAIETMLEGDVETGKAVLRDYIKATIGFEKLGRATGTQPKSLIRMFGARGNPQAKNLFNVIGYLQKRSGLQLQVTGARKAKRRGSLADFLAASPLRGSKLVVERTRKAS
jgi:DNA-binding phage protein